MLVVLDDAVHDLDRQPLVIGPPQQAPAPPPEKGKPPPPRTSPGAAGARPA